MKGLTSLSSQPATASWMLAEGRRNWDLITHNSAKSMSFTLMFVPLASQVRQVLPHCVGLSHSPVLLSLGNSNHLQWPTAPTQPLLQKKTLANKPAFWSRGRHYFCLPTYSVYRVLKRQPRTKSYQILHKVFRTGREST